MQLHEILLCLCVTTSQLVTRIPSIYALHQWLQLIITGDRRARILSVIDRWGKTTTCPCASRRWSPRASKPAPATRHRYARGRRRRLSSRSTSAARSAARRSRRTKRSADTRQATASRRRRRRHTMAGRHRRRPSIRREPRRRRRRLGAAAPGGTSARCATGTSPQGKRSTGKEVPLPARPVGAGLAAAQQHCRRGRGLA